MRARASESVIGAAPDPAAVTNDLRYTVTVTNRGPDTATGLTNVITLPASGTLKLNGVNVIPGQEISLADLYHLFVFRADARLPARESGQELDRLVLGLAMLSFVMTVIWGAPLIVLLRRFRIGKQIRIDGPQTHQVKMGTPTMGGLMIVVPVLGITALLNVVSLLRGASQGRSVLLPLAVANIVVTSLVVALRA